MSFFAKQIQNQIVKDVANVKHFTVIADETSDIDNIEQFSLSVHFVKNNEIYEEFVCFLSLTSSTGGAPADCILRNL